MAWQYRPGACSTGRRSPAAAVGVVVAATEAQSPLIEPIACRHYPATHPTSPHRQAPTCLPHDESPQCRWKQSLACVERLMQANTTRRSHHDGHIGAPQAIKPVSHLARAQSTRQKQPSCRIAECSVRARRQTSPQDHAAHTAHTHARYRAYQFRATAHKHTPVLGMHSATHCVKVGARVRIRLKMAVQLGDRAVHAGACTYTVRREWQSVRVSEGRLNGTTHCCVSKQPSSVEMEGWIDSHPHGPVCKPTTSQRNDTIHIHTHSEQPHGTAGQAARSDEATKEHLDRTNPSPQHAALLHTLHRHTHTACAPRTCTTTMFTRIQHLQGARHAHRPESRTPAMLNQSARFVCEHETFWFGRKSIRAGACDPSSCPSTSRRRRSEHAYRAGLSLELARQRCELPRAGVPPAGWL